MDEPDGPGRRRSRSGSGYTVSSTEGAAAVAVADDDDAPPATPEIAITGGAAVDRGRRGDLHRDGQSGARGGADGELRRVGTSGSDFVADGDEGRRPLIIPAGAADATFTVVKVDDAVEESDGLVTVTVTAGTGYTVLLPRCPPFSNPSGGQFADPGLDSNRPDPKIIGSACVASRLAAHNPLKIKPLASRSPCFGSSTRRETVPERPRYVLLVSDPERETKVSLLDQHRGVAQAGLVRSAEAGNAANAPGLGPAPAGDAARAVGFDGSGRDIEGSALADPVARCRS